MAPRTLFIITEFVLKLSNPHFLTRFRVLFGLVPDGIDLPFNAHDLKEDSAVIGRHVFIIQGRGTLESVCQDEGDIFLGRSNVAEPALRPTLYASVVLVMVVLYVLAPGASFASELSLLVDEVSSELLLSAFGNPAASLKASM